MYYVDELFSYQYEASEKGGEADVTSTYWRPFTPQRNSKRQTGPQKAIVRIYLFYLSSHKTQSNQRAMSIVISPVPEEAYYAKFAKTQEGAASIRTGSSTLTEWGSIWESKGAT